MPAIGKVQLYAPMPPTVMEGWGRFRESHSIGAEPFSLTMTVTDGEDVGGHCKLGAQLRAKAQRHGHAKHIWEADSAPCRLEAKS